MSLTGITVYQNILWNQFSSSDWVMMSQFNLKSIYLITYNFANSSFFCKVNTWLSVYMDYFPVISHCRRTWSLFEQIVNLCLPEIHLVRFGWNLSNSSFREKMKMWIVDNDTDFDDDHSHRTKPIWTFNSAWLKYQKRLKSCMG